MSLWHFVGPSLLPQMSYEKVSFQSFQFFLDFGIRDKRWLAHLPLKERFSSLVVQKNDVRYPHPEALNQTFWAVAWELEFLTNNPDDTEADG